MGDTMLTLGQRAAYLAESDRLWRRATDSARLIAHFVAAGHVEAATKEAAEFTRRNEAWHAYELAHDPLP